MLDFVSAKDIGAPIPFAKLTIFDNSTTSCYCKEEKIEISQNIEDLRNGNYLPQ